jgi:methylated-DNA-protein-cysteine methyltransferase-like protein
MKKNSIYSRIYIIVECIPRGKVATYGQVAKWAGLAGGARQVGYALHNLPEGSGVPWHRVINAKGGISFHPDHPSAALQQTLLESEGIIFFTYSFLCASLKKTGQAQHVPMFCLSSFSCG